MVAGRFCCPVVRCWIDRQKQRRPRGYGETVAQRGDLGPRGHGDRPRSRCSTGSMLRTAVRSFAEFTVNEATVIPAPKLALAGSLRKMRELAGDGNGKILLTLLPLFGPKARGVDVTETVAQTNNLGPGGKG